MTHNVTFFTVRDGQAKLNKLVELAQKHLYEKNPLLFLVSDPAAFEFLDKLLWSLPPESFIPHPSHLITVSFEPKEPFHTLFNLRPAPLMGPYKMVYEFEDQTSPEKLQLSQKRYQSYREANYSIISS